MNNLVNVSLTRNNRGRIVLKVKAAKEVEDIFRTAAGESTERLIDWGATLFTEPTASPSGALRMYLVRGEAFDQDNTVGEGYVISGSPNWLTTTGRNGVTAINLSFMLIQGISEDEGVTLWVDSMLSRKDLEKAAELIGQRISTFLSEYFTAFNCNIEINRS